MTNKERIQVIGGYRQSRQTLHLWLTGAFIFCNSFVLGFDTWWIWGIGSVLTALLLIGLTIKEGRVVQIFTAGRGILLTKRLYRLYSYWIGAVTGAILFSRLQIASVAWVIIGLGIVVLAWTHYQTVQQLRQADSEQPTRDEVTKHYRSYERSTYADERKAN
ncbi:MULTISPECIES: hypothetical protein [unclassified Exiguobacterium]|uniref:hypothetical protein n=1 Tax=unclassified Exiguobacterium TaxID=2644629 RepID=UPI001BEBBB5D|nr:MULTISPECIES: hypothetical protein [unclassified Exiguobacterium]